MKGEQASAQKREQHRARMPAASASTHHRSDQGRAHHVAQCRGARRKGRSTHPARTLPRPAGLLASGHASWARASSTECEVAAAEQVDVHEQRIELVERDAFVVPGRERVRLLVGGEHPRAEAAEQPHHRQIDLAVAAVDGRIDQAGRAGSSTSRLPPHRSPCSRAGGSAGPTRSSSVANSRSKPARTAGGVRPAFDRAASCGSSRCAR